jgi:hypothetical protein
MVDLRRSMPDAEYPYAREFMAEDIAQRDLPSVSSRAVPVLSG